MAEGSWIRRTRRVAGRVWNADSKNSSLKFLVYLQGIFLSHQAGPSRHRAPASLEISGPCSAILAMKIHQNSYITFKHYFGAILRRFGFQLGPQLGPKIAPKSIQEPSKSRPKSHLIFDRFFDRFLVDFRPPNRSKIHQKSINKSSKQHNNNKIKKVPKV